MSIQTTSSPRFGRLCRLAAFACLVAVIGLPPLLAGLWAWADPASLYLAILPGNPNLMTDRFPTRLDSWQRLLGFALSMGPAVFSMIGLMRVRRCFSLFAAGCYFDPRAVAALRGFAGMTAASVGLGLVVQAPLSALLTWQNPAGQRLISLGIDGGQVHALFFAATVWIIAAVMARAVDLARENEGFV